MKTLAVILLLCVQWIGVLDESRNQTITIANVKASGQARAIVVCITGDRAKRVRDLYGIATELSIIGPGLLSQ